MRSKPSPEKPLRPPSPPALIELVKALARRQARIDAGVQDEEEELFISDDEEARRNLRSVLNGSSS
jgi:hypothetical protein